EMEHRLRAVRALDSAQFVPRLVRPSIAMRFYGLGMARATGGATPVSTSAQPPSREGGMPLLDPIDGTDSAAPPGEGTRRTPRVWAVLCYRSGDNSQILALAEALGWPFEVKRLAYRRLGRMADLWRGTTLLGIDRRHSSFLGPPWPDLVISAAMRNEPVCRWIRKQSRGRTRYVHLGKPWARLASFDLVVTTPEHGLPWRSNVVQNALSLHRVTPENLATDARAWEPRLAHLPRPFVAVLVGGYAGPHALDRDKAERLGREASALARKQGGSLLITTSYRTSREATAGLLASVDVPHRVFCYRPDAGARPYLSFLSPADSIVVTCDSASMLAEACATRKPVYMFDLARDDSVADAPPPARTRGQRLAARWRRCNWDRLRALLYRQVLLRLGPLARARDIAAVHASLLASGRAVWLGQPFPSRWPRPLPLDEVPRTRERVRALLRESSQTATQESETSESSVEDGS